MYVLSHQHSYFFLLEYCDRCNWKKNISPHECMCVNKSHHLKTHILLESQDVDRLYYKCNLCTNTHSVHKKSVPLFSCTTYGVDWYKCCKRLETNCILKKVCNHCITPRDGINLGFFWYCPTCDRYIIQYLNGQQIPCHDDDNEITPNGGIINLSQPGLCTIEYKTP